MQTKWLVLGSTILFVILSVSSTYSADGGPSQNAKLPAPRPSATKYHDQVSAPRDPKIISTEVLTSISRWLSANFNLPATKIIPNIKLVSQRDLVAIRYRDSGSGRNVSSVRQTGSGEEAFSIVALYDASGPTVYLARNWRGDNAADVSVLVHEMVHHLQHMGRMPYDCPQAREKLAYMAQARWLADRGRTLAEEFGTDSFTIFIRSACGL